MHELLVTITLLVILIGLVFFGANMVLIASDGRSPKWWITSLRKIGRHIGLE